MNLKPIFRRGADQPETQLNAGAAVQFEWPLLTISQIFFDLLLIYLAFATAFLLRFKFDLAIFKSSFEPAVDYYNFSLLSIPVWLLIFAAVGLYNRENILGGTREYELVFNAATLGMFVNIGAGFLLPDELILARGWVILAWGFSFIYVTTGRFLIRRVVYGLRLKGYFQSNTVIVGSNTEASLVADQLIDTRTAGLRVVGFVRCNDFTENKIKSLNDLGSIEELEQIIKQNGIQVVVLISSALTQQQILETFQNFGTAKELDLRLSSGLYEIITTGMRVKEEGMVPLVVINKVRLTGADQVLKTIFDFTLAMIGIIILLPVFAVIAVLIKLDSPGPVIYLRGVMGVNGKQFNAFKFRTMVVNSDEILEARPELIEEYKKNFKLRDDPRITRVGRFLRKTSLDEIPQLVNILKNEMSLVGPRMITPEELQKYNQWGINLLTVKPGLTGLWQVRGRSDVSYEERVRFDMYYVRNWTIWLDLQIIFQTLPAIWSRRGAY